MRRASRFQWNGLPVAPWRGAPPVGEARRPAAPECQSEALRDLLAALRGHEVTLLVGNRWLAGKLVSADPVVLVDRAGRVTQVRTGAVRAVTF